MLAERQSRSSEKVLQKKSESIRKAAVEAINSIAAVENKVESSVEKPRPAEHLQELKKRAENTVQKSENPESANIREMLLSGMTVEEIARETGLGRGAIELVQQMTRKQLERK